MSSHDTRLSQIGTVWDEVWAAQADGRRTVAAHARWELLKRYGGAAGRYLLGAVKDTDQAADLAQEFAVQFLDGGVKGANPEKGRYRDYLKGVLRNLSRGHHRKAARRPMVGGESLPEPAVESDDGTEFDQAFRDCWRSELLANTWAKLQRVEEETGQPVYSLLRVRADQPDWSSDQLAADMSRRLGREITAAACRKALQRARERFTALLVDEVRGSLSDPSEEAVRDELIDLGLYEYCRPATDPPAAG